MKRRPDDYARLMHIMDAVMEIENYVSGYSFNRFQSDSKTRFASIKQFEIIGEAAYHVSKPLKKKHIEVPWEKISSLRHILVHEYYGVAIKFYGILFSNTSLNLKNRF